MTGLKALAWLGALGLLASSGCVGPLDLFSCASATMGDKGKGTFAYEGCRSVSGNSLAAGGAKSSIAIDKASFVSVTSTNPQVATFTVADASDVAVVSGMPGTTELQLLDGQGAVVDPHHHHER